MIQVFITSVTGSNFRFNNYYLLIQQGFKFFPTPLKKIGMCHILNQVLINKIYYN